MSVIVPWAALIVWFSNSTTRSGRVLVGQVAEVEPEVLAFFVAERLEPIAQAVERRRHMVKAHVKEGDSVDLGRWLCLGGERRDENAESKRGRERRAYDHHAATC